VSDIFREVEEEVRRDRLERIWKEYGDYIVAAIAIAILAVAAYRLWNVYQAREAARASVRYISAQRLLESGQAQPAAREFAHLSQTAPKGYAKLSQMQEADALAASGNAAAALANYRKLIDSGDEMLSSIARIRAAWILVEGAPKSEVESMLGGLAAKTSPWHPVAGEILAYADYHAGDAKRALVEFRALAKDPKSPAGVRGRSNAMATFLAAGGEHDIGKPLYPELPGTLMAGPKIIPRGTTPSAPPAPNSQGALPANTNTAPANTAPTNSNTAPANSNTAPAQPAPKDQSHK
jgi:hypothetical protein